MLWLDEYERSARLAPGLIALFPLPILVTAFGLRHNPVLAVLVSLVVAVGAPLILAKYVRARGRHVEKKLYEEWGSPPTTLLLSPNGTGASDAVQSQRRANVERVCGQLLPTTPLPNDVGAQQVYLAAISTLRQKTQDHATFPLVFEENKSYGFERNVFAIRAEGRIISVFGLFIAATGWALAAFGKLDVNPSALLGAALVVLCLVFFWTAWPTKERVRRAGVLYAERLLDAAVVL